MNNLIFKKNCGTVQNRVTVSLAIILKILLIPFAHVIFFFLINDLKGFGFVSIDCCTNLKNNFPL